MSYQSPQLYKNTDAGFQKHLLFPVLSMRLQVLPHSDPHLLPPGQILRGSSCTRRSPDGLYWIYRIYPTGSPTLTESCPDCQLEQCLLYLTEHLWLPEQSVHGPVLASEVPSQTVPHLAFLQASPPYAQTPVWHPFSIPVYEYHVRNIPLLPHFRLLLHPEFCLPD